jgi:hypothetical protein
MPAECLGSAISCKPFALAFNGVKIMNAVQANSKEG